SHPVGGAIFSYLWTFPGSTSTLVNPPSVTFAQEGTYNVPLLVTDIAGAQATDTSVVTITEATPTLVAPANQTTNEGTAITLSTTFTDAGTLDTHSAAVAWGDGSTSPATVVEQNGSGTITASHTYMEEGGFTATVTLTDNGGPSVTATCAVTSNDVPLQASLTGEGQVAEGAPYTVSLSA